MTMTNEQLEERVEVLHAQVQKLMNAVNATAKCVGNLVHAVELMQMATQDRELGAR